MPLTLTVLRCPPNVAPEMRQVNGGEFSIGRGSENDWVLPDPAKHLSKRHCVLAYRQGTWQVAGTSTNGTFVNRDEAPLESRSPHILEDGDRLILGVYEIEVRVTEDVRQSWEQFPPASEGRSTASGNPFNDDPFAPGPLLRASGPSAGSGKELNPFSPKLPETFNPLLPDEDEAYPEQTHDDHSPAISDAISLPAARSVLPDDWDLDDLAPEPMAPRREVIPKRGNRPAVAVPLSPVGPASVGQTPADPGAKTEPARTDTATIGSPISRAAVPPLDTPAGDLLAAFLRGAGMETTVPPDPVQTMGQLGAAFRAVVSGIRQALIARSELKREFRIEETLIRRRGNNLLKFSANDDDALSGLLGAGRRSDMDAEQAITDALTDIRLHELATMTAMQSAVRALVSRLGPKQIRDGKEQGGGMALLSNRKARAWDAYEALHADVLRGLSDDFDSVFGKRFALAYEQAMKELLAGQKTGRNDRP